jgi:hypothetical protein
VGILRALLTPEAATLYPAKCAAKPAMRNLALASEVELGCAIMVAIPI